MTDTENHKDYESILRLMPAGELRQAMKNAIAALAAPTEEIRLRSLRPPSLIGGGIKYYIDFGGGIHNIDEIHTAKMRGMSKASITSVFRAVCENSVYAYTDELRQGFVTLHGGHRVGFAGRASIGADGNIESLRDISSINIRIAREYKGCAEAIAEKVICGGRVRSTLIISPPGIGKTTALRDLTRIISDKGFKVGVADDRGEIAAMSGGMPANDIGIATDVIEYAPKGEGINILLRCMSPEVIITDELVTEAEISAVCRAKGCGAAMIATAHGTCLDEHFRKPLWIPIVENHVFELLVLLKGRHKNGSYITEMRRLL